MSDNSDKRGWFWPTSARKCHFDGGDGRALCGKWARYGLGGAAPLDGGEHSPPSKDDCTTCRRRLDLEHIAPGPPTPPKPDHHRPVG